MHIITQAANALLDYNSADVAKLLPISKTGRSIFQTCVAQWNDFFCAVGTDCFGAITNDMLVILFPSGFRYFGECSGVVKWLAGHTELTDSSLVSNAVNVTFNSAIHQTTSIPPATVDNVLEYQNCV